MTADPNTDHDVMAEWHARQTECPVIAPLTVDELLGMGREQAAEALSMREDAIENMAEYPLTHCWEPDIWRRIDLKVAEKRLEHPGMVLEIFVTGGMRPGKSFSCARRITAQWMHTEKAVVFALAETMPTSRKLQQQPVERFLPEEISPISGKHKSTKHERFKFSGGHFTNEEFSLKFPVTDETGRRFIGGGDFVFRFFSQEIGTFQGYELTCAWSDELVPKNHVIAIKERMATRAGDTRNPVFLERIRRAREILESGRRLTVAQLGSLYHGVHLISFTPYLGWNETVNYFLRNARKFEFETSPDLRGRPGVKDPTVPRFAQPENPTQLVAYIFTSDNRIKDAYPALSAQLKEASEAEIRIKLHGDVSQDWTTVFGAAYDEAVHVKSLESIDRDGTIYEVLDPAGKKPWVVMYLHVDPAGRVSVVQEWPCPAIQIEGMMPGAWAVPSEGSRLNGDEGPAQKMRLNWSNRRYLQLFWELRKRLFDRFKQTGKPFRGRVQNVDLCSTEMTRSSSGATYYVGGVEQVAWRLTGEVVNPFDNLMDPRFAETASELAGEQVSLQTALADGEHGIFFRKASGVTNEVGDVAIQDRLSERILGLPGLMVVDECENTRFMLRTYAIPEHKQNTAAKDEACVDFRDVLAYGILSGPEYVGARQNIVSAGGSFGARG